MLDKFPQKKFLLFLCLALLHHGTSADTSQRWTQGDLTCGAPLSRCSDSNSEGRLKPGEDVYVGYVFFAPNGFCALNPATLTCEQLTLVQFAVSGVFTIRAVCPSDNSQMTMQIPVHNDYLADPGTGSDPSSAYPSPDPTASDTYQGTATIPQDCNDDYQVMIN